MGPDRSVEDDEFKQVGGSIGPEYQIAGRLLGHLLDHDRVP